MAFLCAIFCGMTASEAALAASGLAVALMLAASGNVSPHMPSPLKGHCCEATQPAAHAYFSGLRS